MARLTIDDLKVVREALFDGRNSWYDIGVELDVSPATLDNINAQFRDNAGHCLREMLKVWLKGLDCSWNVIVAALMSKALRENTGTLAAEIEKDYCSETADSTGALSTTGNSQEGIVSELQAEVRKLKSEMSALKTQQKLDQADLASATEPSLHSGIDISAKGSFIVTSDKAHLFELKGFGLRLRVPEGALPPDVTETKLHVQASLSGQYRLPKASELASAVYWLSAPVKFLRPVTVEIQHNAAFEDPSSKLCFTICRSPEGGQPHTFEKLEGGVFIPNSCNGSISLSGFSGLAIIMPEGGPQHFLSQLWYAKKSERDFSAYYVITKDLAALESAVQACYSDEAIQGHCERIAFEGEQIMVDLPMKGIKAGEWKITSVYPPVIHLEDAKACSSERLPVCELAVQWEGTYSSNMPPRFTHASNLLGAKGAGAVVLDIKKSAFEGYLFKLFYSVLDDNICDVHCAIAECRSHLERKFIEELGAIEGPEMRFIFESSTVSIEIPAAVSGWRIIQPTPKLQISTEQAKEDAHHQFRVIKDTNSQEPLSMDVHLKGARPHNNSIRVCLDPSVWGAQKSLAAEVQQQKVQQKKREHEKRRLEDLEHIAWTWRTSDKKFPNLQYLLSDTMGLSSERQTELSGIKSTTEKLIGMMEKRDTELSEIKSDTNELIRRTAMRETQLPGIKSDAKDLTRRTEMREIELFGNKSGTEELIRRIKIQPSKSFHHTLRRSLSTPDMRQSRCLDEMDVIGKTTLSVTNEAQTFSWAGYGLKLHIPPASLPAGVRKSSIEIKAILAGPFSFPEDATLVSAVYCLQNQVVFSQPISVQIQHCGTPSDDHSLTFARASMNEPPYEFTALKGGLFPPDSSYACIQLDQFSLVAILFQKLWGLLTSLVPERLYCAHIYYTKETVNTWRVHFVVTHYLEAYITAVSERYSEAVAGPDFHVTFEGEEIALDLPKEGVTVNDSWTITPLTHPKVSKQLVDTVESCARLPSCQLRIKWTGIGAPGDLEYRVALKGAKEPSNFFLITLECETATREHRTLRTGRLVRGRRVPGDQTGPSTSLVSSPSRDEASSTEPFLNKYQDGVQSAPELPDLMNEVAAKIPQKWHEVGIQLGMEHDQLIFLSQSTPPGSRQFASLFTAWKNCMKKEYTWAVLIQALKTPAVNEPKLARELSTKLTI